MLDLAEYVTDSRDIEVRPQTIWSDETTSDRYCELDFETGAVLGLYLAAGSMEADENIQITTLEDGVRGFLAEQQFQLHDRVCRRLDKPFGRFVEREFGSGSQDKSLPSWVFDAPDVFKAGVLSGYLDGGGTVDATVTAMAASRELLTGIRELLRHFGIWSTVRESSTVSQDSDRGFQRLRIEPGSLARLRAVVELKVAEQAAALTDAVESFDEFEHCQARAPVSEGGPIPNEAAQRQLETQRQYENCGPAVAGQSVTRQENAGHSMPEVVADTRRMQSRVRKFARSDIQWQRVVDIEELEETRLVYDLDVRLNDNFIADGVFVHNSNTASVVAEELLEHGLPMLIIDTDGEYYGLKGRYELLHVGADTDCDATIGVNHAEKLAELALVQNVPVILDVSGYVEEDLRIELVRRVIERLFDLGKQVRKPFLVFVEEIHEFLPQNGKVEGLSDMLITIAKRGRKRGIGICGMSQRPAAVDKDFITQCDWVVWHRLTWDNDKRVASQMLGNDVAADIDDLDTGEALLMTDWDERINRVRFRRKRTYDAGATPDLDDIDSDSFSPVRTGLIDELADSSADLNDIDLEDVTPTEGGKEPSAEAPTDLETAAQAASETAPDTETALETSPATEDQDDPVVTVPSRSVPEPSYAPPEPSDEEGFDPVWELGHLMVYLAGRVVSGLVAGVNTLGGMTIIAKKRGRRDLDRLIRYTRRTTVRPAADELETVAATRVPDRLIAAAVIALIAIALILLLVS
jgi:hypothetical protein